MKTYTYAGPLALSPVTASNSSSLRNSVFPNASNMVFARLRQRSDVSRDEVRAVIPSPIVHGVFGMALTKLTLVSRISLMDFVVIPAAMEIISFFDVEQFFLMIRANKYLFLFTLISTAGPYTIGILLILNPN